MGARQLSQMLGCLVTFSALAAMAFALGATPAQQQLLWLTLAGSLVVAAPLNWMKRRQLRNAPSIRARLSARHHNNIWQTAAMFGTLMAAGVLQHQMVKVVPKAYGIDWPQLTVLAIGYAAYTSTAFATRLSALGLADR